MSAETLSSLGGWRGQEDFLEEVGLGGVSEAPEFSSIGTHSV